ncbi:MAG: nucleotidyltransferase family protein [Anaerobacillus sp.]
MKLETKEDIIGTIQQDEWMMHVLHTTKQLELPDWWVSAGFVRSKIWDMQHEFSTRTQLTDVDVIYFDRDRVDESLEKSYENRLKEKEPGIPWSVKNQARMHTINQLPPYESSIDAISKFPETATALGVKIDTDDNLRLAAPCGIQDVIQMKVRPTWHFAQSDRLMKIYQQRVENKSWTTLWGNVEICEKGWANG